MADVTEKPTENVEEKTESSNEVSEPEENNEKNGLAKSEVETTKTGKSVEDAIIRQVEYYFGDANLHRDKFLLEQIEKDSEGWVPLSVLMTFKRLAALSTDADVIVKAILKSEEGLVEVSEDREKVRRHPERVIPEYNEVHRKELMTRTSYAKGFPLDAEMSDIIEFFTPYEKVLNISMRKYYDKADKVYKFKGSVFAVFEKKDQAKNFIEKEGLSFKERPLVRKWQEDYLAEKREEREREKQKLKKTKPKPEEKQIILPKGTVLHFEGVNDDSKREIFKEAVEKVDSDFKIAYIQFQQGDKEGHIRFQDEGNAEKFLAKLTDQKLKIKDGLELTMRTLADEEETDFLAKVVEDMKKTRNSKQQRHDKGGNRKRRFGNFSHKKEKKQKTYGDN